MQNGTDIINSPKWFRKMLRNQKIKRRPTTFDCPGFKQANVSIFSKKYANDFYNFVKGNQGAIPLLYASKVGEVTAGPLSEDSDFRTDIPLYNKVENGKITGTLENLLEYDLSDYVAFYIGCSFSFNSILVANGILKHKNTYNDVPIYETNISTYPSGDFSCKVIVSVRAIHKSKLSMTATLAHPLTDVHGAPVHIGNPKLIGIDDVEKPINEEDPELGEDDVPVFWGCGVTGTYAVTSAKIDLAFTHTSGYMFITDVVQDDIAVDYNDPKAVCEVIKYNEKSNSYSVLSKATLETLESIFSIVKEDPMSTGIRNLVIAEDFTKSALALSHATSVAMITGFPCRDGDPPHETDGLPGVVSLTAALHSLGKRVVLLVDASALTMHKNIINKMVGEGSLVEEIEVVPYRDGETKLKDTAGNPLYDVVLSTERAGRSSSGKYYTSSGVDISTRVSPIDNIFVEATACADVTTIAIGDVGNELGMGKVFQKICEHIPLGEKIACVESTDLLIAAGVSNWGCYELSVALYALRSCPVHERYVRKATGFPVNALAQMTNCLPSVHRERRILEIVESFGIKDGLRSDQNMSVDGLFFDKEHTDILNRMLDIVQFNEA